MTRYQPERLNLWTRPQCYMGAEWPDYYVFLGRNRDSDALERANFDAALAAIGGEQFDESQESDVDDRGLPLVLTIQENHWLVGWVEWIGIHRTADEALRRADAIMERLDGYPVVDEDLWSDYEQTEADEVWRNCFSASERVAYIREHRSQFEFRNLADMLGCVRGDYFAGYASELIGG